MVMPLPACGVVTGTTPRVVSSVSDTEAAAAATSPAGNRPESLWPLPLALNLAGRLYDGAGPGITLVGASIGGWAPDAGAEFTKSRTSNRPESLITAPDEAGAETPDA